ncbi:MAG: FtsX-like permease family protein, partial [Terriglobus sp.]
IAIAIWGTRLILYLAVQIGSKDNYVPISTTPSWPVLLFTLSLAVFTGILFGVAPAWMTSHADPAEALRGANRSVGGNRSIMQKSLVIGQVTMSIVLLSAAALLGRSLSNLKHQDFGFDHHGRYVAWINPTLSTLKPEQMEPLYRQINDRLLAIPGVRAVASATYAPMTGDSWNEGIRVQGQPEPDPKADWSAGWARVTPGFFSTIGAKVTLGRPLTEEDTATTRHVAVVNQAFVNRFFKGQNPIGQHFGENRLKYSGTFEVVGVVRDIRYMTWGYKEAVGPMFWVPEAQFVQYDDPNFTDGDRWSHYLYNIVLWAPGDPPALEEQVRKALTGVNSELVLNGVNPYTSVVNADFQQQDMIATLTSIFGVLGLLLAAIGLYGVMSYIVEQRTSEIGLRMAVGANRADMVRMVLRGSFWQIAIGLGIGIPLAILAGKLLKDQLFNVQPWDPVMLLGAALLLALSALIASALPARRAAGVEPMIALRNEG